LPEAKRKGKRPSPTSLLKRRDVGNQRRRKEKNAGGKKRSTPASSYDQERRKGGPSSPVIAIGRSNELKGKKGGGQPFYLQEKKKRMLRLVTSISRKERWNILTDGLGKGKKQKRTFTAVSGRSGEGKKGSLPRPTRKTFIRSWVGR